ncbi:MAG: DUF4476 domain-containing protein [Bacteroidetes bacterium]|nr:DUF4476 domain-containing protein [Bacteroidota bacterium]
MKKYLSVLFVVLLNFVFSQNNVRVFSGNGELFTVSAFNLVQNKIPQANVLIQTILDDTLKLKIELDNKTKFETTLFLFEKGKPTKNKEFNYRINIEQGKIKFSYNGYYDIIKLPDPLVPVKPIIDTTFKYKNTRLGHFCELKDSKPVYFNNIPKNASCINAMPEEYLNYTNLLMVKADVADEKFIIAENVCRNNCLSVAQLNFLLKYIEFELDKLKLLKIAYFNLTDLNNKKDLEKSFRFESSVSELNSFFKTAVDPKTFASKNCKTPSSPEDVKTFQSELSVYTNDAQRYETFKKLYDGFCYSKDQVVIILNTFIHDREKLDAAKMLYFKCAEKDNFLLISDVFSYNETISELKDFVSKQKN